MFEYEYSIVIERPVEEVFEYMQDIDREPEWQPNLLEAEQTPEGVPAVGTRRRYVGQFMGQRFENIYINTAYEPPHRIAYRTAAQSSTRAVGEVTWQAVAGGTRVTMRVEADLGGPLKFLPRTLIVSLARRELGASLARVKALLEARG